MRILMVQETDWLKRNPHQQHHLLERLAREGHQIRVIDYDVDWKLNGDRAIYKGRQVFHRVSKIFPDAAVELVRAPSLRIPLLEYVFLAAADRIEIARQIREFRPDVIVGLGMLSNYIALRLAQRYKIPFVYYWIDVSHMLIPWKSLQPIGVFFEKRIDKGASRVITINKKLEEFVLGYDSPPERTVLIGAGIDKNRFDPAISGAGIRERYGIARGYLVLLFMGFLYNFAGIKEAALEMAKIAKERPDVKLLIIGDGDAYGDLKAIVAAHGLEQNVILTGKQPYDSIPAFIAAADICMLPAYQDEPIMQDIVPIKMYEYMAMGKPVIATRLPGLVREFGDDNGVIYINRPEEVVVKAIELQHADSIKAAGEKARAFAVRHDWAEITRSFEQVLIEEVKKSNGVA